MKKKIMITVGSLLAVAALFAYSIFFLFFDIQRIKGQELLSETPSPSGTYTLTAYRNNGGATTDYAVLVTLTHNTTERKRNIYWDYHREDANIIWKSETVATINGVQLDVQKDTFDFRRE